MCMVVRGHAHLESERRGEDGAEVDVVPADEGAVVFVSLCPLNRCFRASIVVACAVIDFNALDVPYSCN
jgi:hypothetical protein